MANTTNRGIPKPVDTNFVSHDVALLQAAFDKVDGDLHDLFVALNGVAPVSHSHTIAGVSGLQAALDAKAPVNHTHTLAQLTDVAGADAAAVGYLLVKAASGWSVQSVSATVGTVVAGQVTAGLAGKLTKTVNLSDLSDVAAARSNLEVKKVTVSTLDPSGGANGDIWIKV